jgi:luciferase family oxidoreductase group 1
VNADWTLSVVDQSPIRRGGTPDQALRETITLAQSCERWGYRRYWVAEHHNSSGLACTAPEILIGQIAANTKSIHVGSGGVMLTHYSALKVAEQFRMLETFYPGRIDLGIGRAPGSDQITISALAYPKVPVDVQHFPQQVVDLIGYLSGTMSNGHPFSELKAQAGQPPNHIPDLWLLGSSDYSAQLAGALGLPFAFADFFGHTTDHGPIVADIYRSNFKPSGYLQEPQLNVALQVVCADTQERADFTASSRRVGRLFSMLGLNQGGGMIPPEEASTYEPNDQESAVIEQSTKGFIVGTPDIVREGIEQASERYGTRDITIVSNCFYFEDRLRTYELISQTLGTQAQL